MRALLLALALLLVGAPLAGAAPQNTCIWLGDSIDSFVANDGQAKQMTTHLIESERNVAIRNLSSPATTLGIEGVMGYNNDWTIQSFEHICGWFNYCNCIVITAGTNDFNEPHSSWAQVSTSLNRILIWARDHQKKVLMLDLIWRTAFEDGGHQTMGMSWAEYRDRRRGVCTQYAEICSYAERPPEFDRANPHLFDDADQASGQLLHPNARGHRIRATWIENAAARAGVF